MLKKTKQNSSVQRDRVPALKKLRESVYRQAFLAGLLVVLAVVIVFATTAAWYTNVVQSSGLIVQASSWGFSGEVVLGDGAIQAAPGDERMIRLSATNDGEQVTALGVSVEGDRANSEEMEKRIFFFADSQRVRNGEVMDRVYLSGNESYVYTLLPGGSLVLREDSHNDVPIKWQWVYDVLGYYVLGEMDSFSAMTVQEYLRPIEYDYDEATTVFDGEGNVTQIDGQSVEDFLVEISSKDGYPGVINPNQKSGGYYPVSVDENGYGVWAYLCTYDDIVDNTVYDTQLGTGERSMQYRVTLNISAQNSDLTVQEISSATDLKNAIESGRNVLLQLQDNLVLEEQLTLSAGQRVILDLGGNTLGIQSGSYTAKDTGICLNMDSSMTITNGSVKGGGSGYGFIAEGAELILGNVSVSDLDCALYVGDDNCAADSRIRLVGCSFDTEEETIMLRGNGPVTGQKTQLIVENCSISSGYIGIMGNGSVSSTGNWGTDIQILNSTVSGRWAGVFQPQKDSTLTITDSAISGYTGLAVKGGTVKVSGGSVTGTGDIAYAPAMASSGFTDTADAVYVDGSYNYGISLEIYGNTVVSSGSGKALQVFKPNQLATVDVTVFAGVFSSEVEDEYIHANSVQTTTDGETYTVSPAVPD